MCAIVDVNVVGDLFSANRTEANQYFFEWLDEKHGRLVIGGALKAELRHRGFEEWVNEAIISGRAFEEPRDRVEAVTRELRDDARCRSDDPHVIALARVSGARLLYTNDYRLQDDFTNTEILSGPGGKIYTTVAGRRQPAGQQPGKLRAAHKKLLKQRDLCPRAADQSRGK